MWLFIAQYKKMLALSLIPIIAVVALIGFEVFRSAEDRSQPLAVNAGMKDLLNDNSQLTTPPAARTKPAKAVTSSPEPIPTSSDVEAVKQLEDPTLTRILEKEPKLTAKPKATPKSEAASKTKDQQALKININKASPAELVKLKGIGESKAKAIIAYRSEHSFLVIEDLMKVKGIGPKIFANIKEQLEL